MGSSKSAGAISVPQGGGAIQGIGEKFAPDLFTGTGNFTVPIALPRGRGGFQPQLALVYSTGTGNGPFGLGWRLNVPGVSRKTGQGVPRYDDSRDRFLLSGAEDLLPAATAAGGQTRYLPRTEGLFARISHFHAAGNNYWEVRSKDGLVSRYGTPCPAGAKPAWRDPAVIANPADPTRIFAWQLSVTTDPFGNRIEYHYERDPQAVDGSHRWDQLYLSEIRYVDYGDPLNPRFLVTVQFGYAGRPDPFSDCRAGFEIRTVRRCTQIAVSTHADADTPTRTYEFGYLDQHDPAAAPANDVSLLARIRVVGHDGDSTEELPPLDFAWTVFEPRGRRFLPLQGSDLPALSLASPGLELVDLFGDGTPDILEMNGSVRYWRNLGDGRFDLPRPMAEAPAGLSLADPGVQLIDANGDGRADLLVTKPQIAGYFPMRFGGLWDRRSFHRYRTAPSFDLRDPEVRLVDLDGDGVTDAIRSGSRLECFFNDPQRGWTETRAVARRALDQFPDVSFADSRIKWADMNGDGLQDIVQVGDGVVAYWASLGRGDWAPRVTMMNAARLPFGYDPRRILLGDLDGDGLADLVYVEDGKVTLWINQAGNRWSDPVTIEGTPPVSDFDAVRMTDLLGAGVAGILWTADASARNRGHLFFLDLTGGIKPYLLSGMDNNMGAETRVTYASSTRFQLADERNQATRWRTPLPFPVQAVARVEVVDRLSRGKLSTEYSYHHGYWDGAEREFRGFGLVEQFDSESFDNYHHPASSGEDASVAAVAPSHFSPPTMTRTWFHQGPIGDEFGKWEEADISDELWSGDAQVLTRPLEMTAFVKALPRRAGRDALRSLRGRILRTELYARDGTPRQDRPYTVTEALHGVCEVTVENGRTHLAATGSPGGAGAADDASTRVFFPHTLAQRTTQWERGEDPMSQFTFTGYYTDPNRDPARRVYDPYGRPRSEIRIAVPRGRHYLQALSAGAAGEPYLATHVLTDYAERDDEEGYIVNRVARITSYEITNDGSPDLHGFHQAIAGNDLDRPEAIFAQTLNFYDADAAAADGGAFVGLPFGQLGNYGASTRTETLVLTDRIIEDAYRSGDAVADPLERPPYLSAGTVPAWPAEYPQEFRDRLPPRAGYAYQPGGPGSPYAGGYYAATERTRYDFHADPAGYGRGLVRSSRDALGNDTTTDYDAFAFAAVRVTDPAGLTTTADYDYRVLQPRIVTGPNGNRTLASFTPMGLLRTLSVMGKDGEEAGDTDTRPGTFYQYDFLAFLNSAPDERQPVSVRIDRRVEHFWDAIHAENARRQQNGEPPLTPAEIDALFPPIRADAFPELEGFLDRFLQSRQYTDGFGRLLQTRAQSEDLRFGDLTFGGVVLPLRQDDPQIGLDVQGRRNGDRQHPNVIVSGCQRHDNKGSVIEKYQPFFDIGWNYAVPSENQLGEKTAMFYDARGRLSRSVNPDGSELRTVFGTPRDIEVPNDFAPSAWVSYRYDANDNAGRTHPDLTRGYQHHWNTPTSSRIDALGRTVEVVERSRAAPVPGGLEVEELRTRSAYDIRGNLISARDPLDRLALAFVYDLGGTALRSASIDAGVQRTVHDSSGNVVEQRDAKGALVLRAFDRLNRAIRLWARDDTRSFVTLRVRTEYGDGGDPNQQAVERDASRRQNRLGKSYQVYDEAGLQVFESYDLRGNILETTRQVIADAVIGNVFAQALPNWQVKAYRVDWQPPAGTTLPEHAAVLLDATVYRTSRDYDGLGRATSLILPQDVNGARRTLTSHYDRSGNLASVALDGASYVDRIAYDANGQRVLVAYANGILTRYAYDPHTFRLAHLRSEPVAAVGPITYRPVGAPLQDFAYEYDLAGNLLVLHDRSLSSGIPNTVLGVDALDRTFSYDPLYRLVSASGRECDTPVTTTPWDTRFRCRDVNLTRACAETYIYDAVGNLSRWRHQAGPGSFNRDLALAASCDRLATLTVGGNVLAYDYDESGNLTGETTSRHFEWDHGGRMRVFCIQTQAAGALPGDLRLAEPSIYVHYLYDASGQRVKKLLRRQGGQLDSIIYIEGIFEHLSRADGAENNMAHVQDDRKRIATVRLGAAFPNDNSPAVKYHLGDHLGSSNTVLDDAGTLVDREEYAPFGETSFGSFAQKRYRYNGKERDEESGLYYYGSRFYAPWLARWASCDPAGAVDGTNAYIYAKQRPVSLIDQLGSQASAPDPGPQEPVSTDPALSGTASVSASTATADTISVGDWVWEHGHIAGSSAVTTYNSFQRARYLNDIKKASLSAEQEVLASFGNNDPLRAYEAAYEASEARNVTRALTRTRTTPAATYLSENIDRTLPIEDYFKKYGDYNPATNEFKPSVLGLDPFENEHPFVTAYQIAVKAGDSRPALKCLTKAGQYGGPIGTALGVGVAGYNIYEAAPAERGRVIVQEAGAFAGGAAGTEIGTAAGTGFGVWVAGLLGLSSGPAGWLVLGLAVGGGLAGGWAGGEAGRKGADAAFLSLVDALAFVSTFPRAAMMPRGFAP
jgi:RHS repeat-associated protein